jgi:hypothetical protein
MTDYIWLRIIDSSLHYETISRFKGYDSLIGFLLDWPGNLAEGYDRLFVTAGWHYVTGAGLSRVWILQSHIFRCHFGIENKPRDSPGVQSGRLSVDCNF